MKKVVVVVGELDPGEDNGNDVRRLEREERSTAARTSLEFLFILSPL